MKYFFQRIAISMPQIDIAGNIVKEVEGDSFIDYTYDKGGNMIP